MPVDLARPPVEIGFILAHATAAHEFERELYVRKADSHRATSQYLIDDMERAPRMPLGPSQTSPVNADRLGRCSAIALEPFRLDQTAAQRGRGLLILAGEIVFADRLADAIEGFEWLAIGVQGFALMTAEALRSPDRFD